jgi:hypothetical protein
MESSENVSTTTTTYWPWRESEREHSIIRKSLGAFQRDSSTRWFCLLKFESKLLLSREKYFFFKNGNESIRGKNVVDLLTGRPKNRLAKTGNKKLK